MIVTFYLTSPQYAKPDFKGRQELVDIPDVDEIVEISGHKAEKTISAVVRENSKTNPSLAGLLNDCGAWVICQQT